MSHYVLVDPESSVEFLRELSISLERENYVVTSVLLVDAVSKSSLASYISFTSLAACIDN